MFVFNTMTGDLRVHREAQALVEQGYEVRIFCFLEPGLPEVEKRSGYAIQRLDQRPWISRFFDDRVMRRWARRKMEPPPALEGGPGELAAGRPAVRPCPQPAPRSY